MSFSTSTTYLPITRISTFSFMCFKVGYTCIPIELFHHWLPKLGNISGIPSLFIDVDWILSIKSLIITKIINRHKDNRVFPRKETDVRKKLFVDNYNFLKKKDPRNLYFKGLKNQADYFQVNISTDISILTLYYLNQFRN